ncbi:DUF5753 domain-containing protein [Streptomyces sp. NPDC088923]|uniref:DUF5753 domain-containing protein n=1 Tax=Streptomyces sp. NPDC088923 TaxID=3365913 RepID=UPI003825ECB9
MAAGQERFYQDRYARFKAAEARATIQHKYTVVVPGLLQTEAWARLVLSQDPTVDPDGLERLVAERLDRQELLRRSPAPHLRVILDELALLRRPSDLVTWQEQLRQLIDSAQMPAIVLQLLPVTEGVHDLMGGSLTLLWADDGTAVAYAEGNKHGQLIDDPDEVAELRLSYDGVRDKALSPTATLEKLRQLLEESQ